MKKFLITFIFCSIATFVYSQVIDHSKMLVETSGWTFFTSDEADETGYVSIEKDINGNTWLKYEVSYPYNIENMVDRNGQICMGQYNIPEGNHMYLKLSNDYILILRCSQVIERYSGIQAGHKNLYAYFNLSKESIDILNNGVIIKMRCELKYVIMDMFLRNPVMLRSKFSILNEKYWNKIQEVNNQHILKENPLANF